MRLDDKELVDLCKLATERCETALQSVTQLAPNAPQAYAIGMAVVCSMLVGACDLIQETFQNKDGSRVSDGEAMSRVLKNLMDGLGIECEMKPRTRSARK